MTITIQAMEILSLAGRLIASFIIFDLVMIGIIVVLIKLLFKSIPEDELNEAKENAAVMPK
jgi:hypothetical protein